MDVSPTSSREVDVRYRTDATGDWLTLDEWIEQENELRWQREHEADLRSSRNYI